MINKLGNVNMSTARQKRLDVKKYDSFRASESLQYRVAKDLKPDTHFRFDDDYRDGIKWFNSGLSLEDAPEDLRTNNSFCKGFERGEFESIHNKAMYDEGKKDFSKGIPLEKISDNKKNNEYFMMGYNDASNGRHR